MKKKQFGIWIVSLVIVLVLGTAFAYVRYQYQKKGLSLIEEWEETLSFTGKHLLSEDGNTIYLYNPQGRVAFEKTLVKEELSLDDFGFEGVVYTSFLLEEQKNYGIKSSTRYCLAEGYEGFWPVSDSERLVYIAEDGKKYCIHPKEKLSYPMLADSVKGVDPYGTNVVAFSGDGSYGASLANEVLTILHTDPTDDSLRIVDTKDIDLSRYGDRERKFGAFVGNTQAYFTAEEKGKTRFYAIDCVTGEVAKSALDMKGEYGNPLNRLYAQRLDKSENKKGELQAVWSHLLLGTEMTSPPLKNQKEIVLTAVSPSGEYAVGETDKGEVLVMNEKRAFSVSSVLGEGEAVENVFFPYENILAVTVKAEGKTVTRCYKICF